MATDSEHSHFVCLTFDFDTISYWISQGQTGPGDLSRGEFGLVGARRILELLARNGIQGTWFIPGLTIDTYQDACAAVHRESCAGRQWWRHRRSIRRRWYGAIRWGLSGSDSRIRRPTEARSAVTHTTATRSKNPCRARPLLPALAGRPRGSDFSGANRVCLSCRGDLHTVMTSGTH